MDSNLPTRDTHAQPQDRVMAALANASYEPGIEEPVPGWCAISRDEQSRMGITPSHLDNRKSGFLANVYTNDRGGYVVAMAGTDAGSLADHTTNARQYAGLPASQYDQARELTRLVVEARGTGNVAVTGHSLGGSLASTAALAHGLQAVVFNAAPVHNNQLGDPAQDRAAGISGQVRHYEMPGEFLGHLRRSPSQNRGLPGVQMTLTSSHGRVDPASFTAPLALHSMDATLSSMGRNPMFHGDNERSTRYYAANVRHPDAGEDARIQRAVNTVSHAYASADTPESRRRARGTDMRLAGEISRNEDIRREGGYYDRNAMLARQAPSSPATLFSSQISTPRAMSPSPEPGPSTRDHRSMSPPADSELATVMRRTRSMEPKAASSPFASKGAGKGKAPDRGR